jgi:hypothetical protein
MWVKEDLKDNNGTERRKENIRGAYMHAVVGRSEAVLLVVPRGSSWIVKFCEDS